MLPRANNSRRRNAPRAMARIFPRPVDPSYPKLAGQYPDYLEKALRDYQTGARKNAIMAGLAKPLTRADIQNVSVYLSRLPGPLGNDKR